MCWTNNERGNKNSTFKTINAISGFPHLNPEVGGSIKSFIQKNKKG